MSTDAERVNEYWTQYSHVTCLNRLKINTISNTKSPSLFLECQPCTFVSSLVLEKSSDCFLKNFTRKNRSASPNGRIAVALASMSGEVATRLRSTVRGLLRVMSTAADGFGLGAVCAADWRGASARASQTRVRRRRLSITCSQHERCRETFPVDRIVGPEPHQQLTTGRYHFRRNLQHSLYAPVIIIS